MLLCLIQLMTKPSGPLFWLRPTTWCQPQPQVIPHIYSQHSCFVSYLLLNWNVLLFNVRSAEVKPLLIVNYSQFRCVLIQKAKKKMYQNLKTTCFSRWNLYHLLRYAIKSWKRNSPGLCVFEPCSLDLFPIMISSQQSWLKCHLTVTVSAAPQTLPAGETLKVYASPVFSTRH